MVKIGQRYHDPSLGRWTQRDPLGAGNPYAYTNDDPVDNADPSGLIYTSYQIYGDNIVVEPSDLRPISNALKL